VKANFAAEAAGHGASRQAETRHHGGRDRSAEIMMIACSEMNHVDVATEQHMSDDNDAHDEPDAGS